MTKLLVSDYDYTLKDGILNLKININAVNYFRKNGNLFIIATGRPYSSIKAECIQYNIKYDYLISNNGCQIYNNQDQVLKEKILTKEQKMIINAFIGDNNYQKVNWISNNSNNSLITNNIVEVIIDSGQPLKSLKLVKKLRIILPDCLISSYYGTIYITRNSNKLEAINYINEILKIEKKDIYTIGDGLNDLEMLKEYNGYRPFWSDIRMILKPIKVIDSPAKLIKRINSK